MEWFSELIGEGVPAGPINTVNDGVAFAEELGLEPVVHVGAAGDTVPSVRNPITFSATPVDYVRRPPGLGEHSDDVRAELARPAEVGR
jgi:crotonobetainyl-CoA:carnitine CoA-transferase CaiB-like acyl-CoA transferase